MKKTILMALMLPMLSTTLLNAGIIESKDRVNLNREMTKGDRIVSEIELPDGTVKVKVKMQRGYTTEFILIKNGTIVDKKTY